MPRRFVSLRQAIRHFLDSLADSFVLRVAVVHVIVLWSRLSAIISVQGMLRVGGLIESVLSGERNLRNSFWKPKSCRDFFKKGGFVS